MLSCFSRVWLCATPWTIACQTPLSMGSPGKNTGVGMPVPFPGDASNPGSKPRSPALQAVSLLSEPLGKLVLLTISKSLIGILFWKCCLHEKDDEEVIKSRKLVLVNTLMCKCVFWNLLLFFCMECSGVKMCNEKGKYLIYGAYNTWGTFLQFWLCEMFFTFSNPSSLMPIMFLGQS